MQRIDLLKYEDNTSPTVREPLVSNLFITGPIEFLCYEVSLFFKNNSPWKELFGESVYYYPREDLTCYELPSICVYRDSVGRRQSTSHYYEGNITIDFALPVSLQRETMHQVAETIASCFNLQLRGAGTGIQEIYNKTPGLIAFGYTVEDEKFYKGSSLNSNEALIVSFKAGFKVDLKLFDKYMESDNRTSDYPFIRTLDDLKSIFTTIAGVDNEENNKVEVDLINRY